KKPRSAPPPPPKPQTNPTKPKPPLRHPPSSIFHPRLPNPPCFPRRPSHNPLPMLHYFKFRQDLFAPVPAKDVYIKRPAGKGWPEECPPIRAANSFGFDLLANFDVTFTLKRDRSWRVAPDVVLPSDFD